MTCVVTAADRRVRLPLVVQGLERALDRQRERCGPRRGAAEVPRRPAPLSAGVPALKPAAPPR